jgi:hypothetical protein
MFMLFHSPAARRPWLIALFALLLIGGLTAWLIR